jgi:hypothetical protein
VGPDVNASRVAWILAALVQAALLLLVLAALALPPLA